MLVSKQARSQQAGESWGWKTGKLSPATYPLCHAMPCHAMRYCTTIIPSDPKANEAKQQGYHSMSAPCLSAIAMNRTAIH
jgi:hypothetical protein